MHMSLKEVSEKMSKMIQDPKVNGNLLVMNAIVVQDDDWNLLKEYAPGTVLFNCIDSQSNSHWCQLSLYPDKISDLPN